MLVSPGPSAQTPYLIYVGVYPLPPTSPNPEQDLGTQQRFHGGTNDGGNREKQRGGGERERVTYAQWELTKHLVIKSKLTFW